MRLLIVRSSDCLLMTVCCRSYDDGDDDDDGDVGDGDDDSDAPTLILPY